MRFSRFGKVYEICNFKNEFWYLIRHSILNYSFLLSENEFESLKKCISSSKFVKDFSSLKKAHLVVPDTYSEEKFISTILERSKMNKPFFNIFYLTFDTKCNLDCRYCYTEGSIDSKFNHQVMSKNTLSKIFDFMDEIIKEGRGKYLGEKISFIFYGSEPLLHPELFEESLKKMEQLMNSSGIQIEKQLITNATLLTEDIAKIIKRYDVNVAVSLDGTKESHNKMRVYSNGKGSYDSTIKGIKALKKCGVPFSISCTIGSHNIQNLSNCINFFKDMSAESIGFNLLLDAKIRKLPFVSNFDANIALFNSFKKAENKGFFESRVGRKLKSFNTL
ncbi:MAG: radical SAM protein [Nanoarchaeota archaeon]|nr:radical SAM protein [Nanoarchaeota archaeon]